MWTPEYSYIAQHWCYCSEPVSENANVASSEDQTRSENMAANEDWASSSQPVPLIALKYKYHFVFWVESLEVDYKKVQS